MTDHLLKWMKEHHVPVSRAKYLGLAYGNEMPDPWTPEHEAELPEELQEVYGEYGDAVQLDMFEDKYNPEQPRDPAGTETGGRWSSMGGSGSAELGAGSRAKKGGETAKSNAAFYKGGQFLPSTELPPGTYKVGKTLLKTKRVLTEPGKLEEMPTPLHRSVYQLAGVGAETFVGEGGKLQIRPGVRYLTHEEGFEVYKEVTPEMVIKPFVAQGVGVKSQYTLGELMQRYDKGERWLQLELEEEGMMAGAPHAGGDDKLLLITHNPRNAQYEDWAQQLKAREDKIEAEGRVGDREDSQIYAMKNALKEFGASTIADRDSDKIGFSAVYGGRRDMDESNILAVTLVRYNAQQKVARITLSGGLDEDAHEKSLHMIVARYGDKVERIESAAFGDDLETIAIYERAGFRMTGDKNSTGMYNLVYGSPGPTSSEREAAERLATIRKNEVEARARVAAASLDFNPDNVKFTDEDRTFEVNGKEMYYAGSYTRGEPNVKIYHKHIDLASVAGVTAHEIGHRKLDALRKRYRAEYQGMLAEPGPAPDPNGQYWWQKKGGHDAVMSVDGTLRAPYDKQYPVYDFWERNVELRRDKMREDDGVSAYSKEYWEAFTKLEVGIDKPIHETIAEMTRIKYETGKLPGSPDWKKLHRMIDKVWKELPTERRAEYQEHEGPFW